MSRYIPYVLGVLIGLLVVVSIAAASAQDSTEAEPESFEVGGRTCIFYRGQLDCVCPCGTVQCGAPGLTTVTETRVITVPQVIEVTVVERVPNDVSLVPEETLDTTDSTELVVGEDEVPRIPVTFEDPDPEQDTNPSNDRQRCNQGVGNSSEGCDPGNSNRNQVSNDEEGGQPGDPGRAHNDNAKGKGKDD